MKKKQVMWAAVEAVRLKREAREATAAGIAATLPPGDYYASGQELKRHDDPKFSLVCGTHWDACLIMMATAKP